MQPARAFDPTRAPFGRLARLGVVLDGGARDAQLRALAIMAERVGMESVWIADRIDPVTDAWATDAWEVVVGLAPSLSRARVGALVGTDRRPADALAAAATRLAARLDKPVEIGVIGGNAVTAYAAALAEALRPTEQVRISAAANSIDVIATLVQVVDDLVLPGWIFDDLETVADEARAEAQERGRPASSLGIAALLPASIGRGTGEARVRADAEPLFRQIGHPRDIGIYGTLEECQDRVIALAHAGISDLRCIVPRAADVHDVLAQLTAMTVGTTDVLVPGSLRSPAPPPPETWGGRPDRPPSNQISAGSRRR